MTTNSFVVLESSIIAIVSNFRDFDRNDSSTPENQMKLRACISFIHAEIENYFESIGLKSLDAYVNNSLSKRVRNKIKYALVVYNHKSYEGAPEDIVARIDIAIRTYKTSIQQNNGIKEKDILKILLPVGYPFSELDNTWLATLNSFGAFRGKLIHASMNKINNLIGYNYFEDNIMSVIIPGIRNIDTYFADNYGIN